MLHTVNHSSVCALQVWRANTQKQIKAVATLVKGKAAALKAAQKLRQEREAAQAKADARKAREAAREAAAQAKAEAAAQAKADAKETAKALQKPLQAAAAAADAKAQEAPPLQAAEPVVTAAVPSSSLAEAEDPEVTAALDVATVGAALQEMEAPAQAGDLQAGDPQAAPPALSATQQDPQRRLRSHSRSQSPERAQEGRAVGVSGKDMAGGLTPIVEAEPVPPPAEQPGAASLAAGSSNEVNTGAEHGQV